MADVFEGTDIVDQENHLNNQVEKKTQEVEQPEESVWMKALDLLMRTNYMSAEAVQTALEGGEIGDVISNSLKGLAGKEKTTYRDVLTTAGWKDEDDIKMSQVFPGLYNKTGEGFTKFQKGGIADPGLKGTVGLAGDIFLDPLTYTGFGSFDETARGLAVGKKGIDRLARNIAFKTKPGIIEELLPLAKGTHAGKWVEELAEKLIKDKGMPKKIADQLSKHLVRRHTITFMGKRVLPKFIDDAIVDTTAKMFRAVGDVKGIKQMRETITDMFNLGGSDASLKAAYQTRLNMDSFTNWKMELFADEGAKLRKTFSPKQLDEYHRVFEEGIPYHQIQDKSVKEAVAYTQRVAETLNTESGKHGVKHAMFSLGDKFDPYELPKVMSEEGNELFRKYVNTLESRQLRSKALKLGRKTGLVNMPTDTKAARELTSDWVFDVVGKSRKATDDLMEHLGSKGVRNMKIDSDGILRVGRMGQPDFVTLQYLDDIATNKQLQGKLAPWSIRRANKTLLADMKAIGKASGIKELSNLPDNFKFFYDEFDKFMPARWVQGMENVRKQAFMDDLLGKFAYNVNDVLSPAEMAKGDFLLQPRLTDVTLSKAKFNEYKNFAADIIRKDAPNLTDKEVSKIFAGIKRSSQKTFIGAGKGFDAQDLINYIAKGKGSFDDIVPQIQKVVGDEETAMKVFESLRSSSANFAIDEAKIAQDVINQGGKTFNLSRMQELNRGLRILEKEGADVGVYVSNDQWVKMFKDYGIHGSDAARLKGVMQKDGSVAVKELEKYFKDFPSVSRNIKAHIVDRSALKEMTRGYEKISDFRTVRHIMGLYTKSLTWWKANALIAPGYHFRNMFSNISLNYLGDVTNPKWYKDAFNLQRKYFLSPKSLSKAERKVLDEMAREGVLRRGFFSADLQRTFYDVFHKPKWFSKDAKKVMLGDNPVGALFGTRGHFPKLNFVVGEEVEANARIAHYLAKRAKGFDPKQAGLSVKKFLFDYADLSEFERKIMKNVIPFYTFMRKNIPLQMETLLKRPGKQAVWAKLVNSVQGDLKTKTFLPQWMKEQGAVQVGETADGMPMYAPLQSYMPMADVLKVMHPSETLLQNINPGIKALFESVLTPGRGHSFFTHRPIEGFEGEKVDYAGLSKLTGMDMFRVRKKYANLLNLVRIGSEADRFLGDKSDKFDLGEKVMKLFTGLRIHPLDEDKEITFFVRNVERKIRNLKSKIRYKVQKGDEAGVEEITGKIREMEQELEKKFSDYAKE